MRVPSDFRKPGYRVDPDTVAVYQSLVDADAVLAIDSVDEYGHPWTEPFEIGGAGQITVTDGMGHTLALNDDSWERIG